MRQLHIALLLAPVVASCGSSSSSVAPTPVAPAVDPAADAEGMNDPAAEASEPADEPEDFFAPRSWTGAFGETAVMLAHTIRIEGPEGLVNHVAARADDAFYERSVETTDEGFLQTFVRSGDEAPEIRVRLDRWTMAATARVVILERFDDCPVTVIASGDAIWRDVDGELARANRLEFVGQIGEDTAVRPARTFRAPGGEPTEAPADAAAEGDPAAEASDPAAFEAEAPGDEPADAEHTADGDGTGTETSGDAPAPDAEPAPESGNEPENAPAPEGAPSGQEAPAADDAARNL